MKKIVGITFSFLFLFLFITPVQAQRGDDTKAIYKAAYLFSFTKLTDWPPSYKEGAFKIGILGSGRGTTNLYEELKRKYEQKQVGNQKISIVEYSSLEEVEDRCNILFVERSHTSALSRMKRRNTSTLLVSEGSGAIENGAVIKFVVKDNKLEYELSLRNAQRYSLTIGNQLEELALRVH